jgi:hypothetical protein
MDNPRARRNDLFSERLAEEMVIYDKLNHKAHTLNQTVLAVWESADGSRSVDEIAGMLHRELGVPADHSTVHLALEQLEAAGLLEASAGVGSAAERTSRREVARKLALAGVSAALIPLVASVVAPTPAMAASVGLLA